MAGNRVSVRRWSPGGVRDKKFLTPTFTQIRNQTGSEVARSASNNDTMDTRISSFTFASDSAKPNLMSWCVGTLVAYLPLVARHQEGTSGG